jgi:hypothetical protein
MAIVFNLIVVGLAALIAYWWAHQGLFSALLHCVCVIAAGAIAFALWEPITVNYLLRGGRMDDYMWGVSLVSLFVASLAILRLACDKIIKANVNFPPWVNYVFGGIAGAWAGILTMGIWLIGIGFVQSSTEIMGYIGTARAGGGRISSLNSMVPPVHSWTVGFYSVLSNGAFDPYISEPMRKVYPDLDVQAVSLQRDSFDDGRAKTSLAPTGARIAGYFVCKELNPPQYAVLVEFNRQAFDMPDSTLTVSGAQVRLIGDGGSGWSESKVVYPVKWSQRTDKGTVLSYLYDDNSHYAQNVPGQEQTLLLFSFDGGALGVQTPRFVQIKGTRFKLPAPSELTLAQINAVEKVLRDPKATPVQVNPNAPKIAANDLAIDNGIQPVHVNSNQVAPMRHRDNFLTEGRGTFLKGQSGISRTLRIKGVLEPAGTRVVKLNISRKRSSLDVFGDLNDDVKMIDGKARPFLVDDQGGMYTPIGYLWVRPENVEIFLDRTNGISSKDELPAQPSAGTHEVFLYFVVTKGARITGFMLGETTIGVTDKVIE